LIKEFTPLIGYISWSSFQWIIIINCSKSAQKLKNMSYNAQTDKPTAPMASQHPKIPVWALSAPQIGRKMKKLGLLEVSLFKLAISGSTIRTLLP
jgi:hypothetical protein